jgi:hypothetical protein
MIDNIGKLPYILLILLLGLTTLPACFEDLKPIHPDTGYDPAAIKLPQPKQKITMRILDRRDYPIKGAKISFTPQAGRPLSPGPYVSGDNGELVFYWLPQAKEAGGEKTYRDRIITYHTKAAYKVASPGHFDAQGIMERRNTARVMASGELSSMNQPAKMSPMVEVVVVHSDDELWGRGLRKMADDNPLKSRLRTYHPELDLLAQELGAKLAAPAFSLDRGVLTLYFDWQGLTWAGLEPAPLKTQVALNTGIPLAIACAEDILPQQAVQRMELVFMREIKDKSDPYAAPKRGKVTISAPADDFIKLAKGFMSTDRFLKEHPVNLEIKL